MQLFMVHATSQGDIYMHLAQFMAPQDGLQQQLERCCSIAEVKSYDIELP
jgi:hypothetical protein